LHPFRDDRRAPDPVRHLQQFLPTRGAGRGEARREGRGRGVSEGRGPSAGDVLLGIFFIVCGLCLALVGGGCALFWLATMFSGGDGLASLGIPLLLVSLAELAAGAV